LNEEIKGMRVWDQALEKVLEYLSEGGE
jgi:hypothetical protein